MTMKLNEAKLAAALAERDRRNELVKYIYRTQGDARARLNFEAAADAIGCARATIAHDVSKLAAMRVLFLFSGGTLQINSEYLTD